ncbi:MULTISPECIES: hypothetical protein [Amycolatopsis]|uniref:Uncharacterized protein n=1 Tax=Amycolatopsis dendrobii TaxID=2760662 RepID=A0A7W3VTY7_9PSEU|nr:MULTISPECIES: hypothetical protein [Amycolatopsis]MBB1153143.1 hypothetical protein [Amycolatopsis dendrobii]UKD53876.1 hypothetical protein L3Q65_39300 [Amycolatopsis sp. FU40]
MIAALHVLESAALRLDSIDEVERSREALRDHFNAFEIADSKVDLLIASVGGPDGDWVRTVAHTMAVDLLQADEFSQIGLDCSDSELGAGRTEEELAILRASSSYQSVVGHDLGFGSIDGSVSLRDWWAPKVLSGQQHWSAYSVGASYLIQRARLLSEFLSEFLKPWAQEVVRSRLK